MRGIALWFVLSAAVYLLAGMLFGIVMSASHDHSMSPAHGHLNLVGGAMMAIFGLYYHNVPAAAGSGLARLHFAAATLGLWLLVPGIALAIAGLTQGVAVAGSLATVLSTALFLLVVTRHRGPPSQPA
ncbi:hypothetical protein [Marinimicrococcus flavescens]|uniref:Cytochrome-c oxidase n=1 Tax=Marinimicrococcus flavescens TaxID=3031815 RepID=A0AAP3UZK9_9PROT|nr:hypothetical protein [Marinimicrococcus flavescens]